MSSSVQGLRLRERTRFYRLLDQTVDVLDLTNRERFKFRLILAAHPAARYAFRRWCESERGQLTDDGMVQAHAAGDWLDWLLANGPALVEFIKMLIDLFGGGSESNSLIPGSTTAATCKQAIADCLKQAEALVACLEAINCDCEDPDPVDPVDPDPPVGSDYSPDTNPRC